MLRPPRRASQDRNWLFSPPCKMGERDHCNASVYQLRALIHLLEIRRQLEIHGLGHGLPSAGKQF
jgi:hypothetical protein